MAVIIEMKAWAYRIKNAKYRRREGI